MTSVPVTGIDAASAEGAVTLADLDASVGVAPELPEDEIAVRYYSDEALLTAIRLRRSGRADN